MKGLELARRFWEEALGCLDATGTDGQLRNLIKTNLAIAGDLGNDPLGRIAARGVYTIAQKIFKFA